MFALSLILLFVTFEGLVFSQKLDDRYLCTEKYCETYREEVGCPALDIACEVRNSTHNGRLFPSATECNCCETCLVNLDEGEFCTIGTPGSFLPNKICGPGLYCTEGSGNGATCQPMKDNSKCFKDRIEHFRLLNEGKIGSLRPRPNCDGDGQYAPIVCIPGQNCFCVNTNGERIFGDGLDSDRAPFEMKCECARLADAAREIIEKRFPIFTARCDSTGSYDELQCMNGMCFCAERHGALTNKALANITTELNMLPCYNRTLHRQITSMETYLRPCEAAKLLTISEINKRNEQGIHVISPVIEECQPDGWYLPVRETKTEKYCSDLEGNVLHEYKFLKTDPRAKDMNCKCARARELLLSYKSLDVPQCAENGNYQPAACRRGMCFCLDDNGLQSSQEVRFEDIGSLECCANGACDEIGLSR